jgi:putative hydrolase of the HAD superfamily
MASSSTGSRALILDFGGVVTRTMFETHDLTERTLGLPPGTLTWRGPFDTTTDPLWVRMQAGEITERAYWMTRTREVGALVRQDWTEMQDFVRAARGAEPGLILRPEARDAILAAKAAGVRLAILSNELDLFYGEGLRKRFPLIELFEVIVDATYTGILKPEPRSYQACLDALGLPAEACVFVDDQHKNVEGALAVNLPTVHFDVTQPGHSYARALAMLGVIEQGVSHA